MSRRRLRPCRASFRRSGWRIVRTVCTAACTRSRTARPWTPTSPRTSWRRWPRLRALWTSRCAGSRCCQRRRRSRGAWRPRLHSSRMAAMDGRSDGPLGRRTRFRAVGASAGSGGARTTRVLRVRHRGHREVIAARAVGAECERLAIGVVAVDCRSIEPTEQGFRSALASAIAATTTVTSTTDFSPWLAGPGSQGCHDRYLRDVPACGPVVASRVVAGAGARCARGGRRPGAADARVVGRARTARGSRGPSPGSTRRRQRADNRANRRVRGRPCRDGDRRG